MVRRARFERATDRVEDGCSIQAELTARVFFWTRWPDSNGRLFSQLDLQTSALDHLATPRKMEMKYGNEMGNAGLSVRLVACRLLGIIVRLC